MGSEGGTGALHLFDTRRERANVAIVLEASPCIRYDVPRPW